MRTQRKLFAWVDATTLEFVVMKSGKAAWTTSGAAKNAFNLHFQYEDFAVKLRELSEKSHWHTVDQLWAKQDRYKLVEVFFNGESQITVKED